VSPRIKYGTTLLIIAGAVCGGIAAVLLPRSQADLAAAQLFGFVATGAAVVMNYLRRNPQISFRLPGYPVLGNLKQRERHALFWTYIVVAAVFSIVPFAIALMQHLT